MKPSSLAAFAAGSALTALLVVSLAAAPAPVTAPAAPQDAAPQMPSAEEMADMMAKMQKFTRPGDEHKLLDRFLGTWDTSTSYSMPGMNAPMKGTTTFRKLLDGYFVIGEGNTPMPMMGDVKMVTILGYDRFKMSYVSAMMSTMDTALRTAEGDLTRDGKSLLTYGTLDEYLTGEHDKMVKYAWRFPSDDKMVLEVHDLPIGEENTKVVEVVFTRAK